MLYGSAEPMTEDDARYASNMSLPPIGGQQPQMNTISVSQLKDSGAPASMFTSSAMDLVNSQPMLGGALLPRHRSPPRPNGRIPSAPDSDSMWDNSAIRPLRSMGGSQRHRSVSRSRSPQPAPRAFVQHAAPLMGSEYAPVHAEPIPMATEVVWEPMQPQVEIVEMPQIVHTAPQPAMQFVEVLPTISAVQVVQTEPVVHVDEIELRRDVRYDGMREYDDIRRQQQQEFSEQLARMTAQIERAVRESITQSVRVVPNEVPVEVVKVVKEEIPRIVETTKYVDRHVEVPVETVVTKEVAVPVEIPGKTVFVEKPVVNEVFVDRVVQHEVPVPFDKVVVREVPMPYEVERVVEKIVEKEVPVYIEQIVMREVPVPVEKIIWKEVDVPVEKIVQVPVVEIKVQEIIREVPVESVRVEKVETFIDRPVITPVIVERVIEKDVPVRVETIKEVIVEKEVPVYVDRIIEKPEIVYVDRIVEKPTIIEKEIPIEKIIIKEVEKIVTVEKEVPVEKVVVQEVVKIVEVEKVVTKEVPVEVEKIVFKEVPVEVEKIVYRDREPAAEEAPIQFARENKKVQRSAAPKVQRSAAPPIAAPQRAAAPKVQRSAAPPIAAPQNSGMIEDTFPIIEFEEKTERFIEDTFPIIEFDSADAVEAAPRRSRMQRSAAPVAEKKESGGDATINRDDAVLYSSTSWQTQEMPGSWTSSSRQAAESITEEELMAVRREIERSVDARLGSEQQQGLRHSSVSVVGYQSSMSRPPAEQAPREPVTYSSGSVMSGESVRQHGLSVPITPDRDRGRKVGLGLNLALNAAGEIFVTNILPGFGAIKSGLIGLNDVLLQIDDTPVASMTLEETKARTTGIEGTSCKLKLRAGDSIYDVNLVRSVPRNSNQLEELSDSSGAPSLASSAPNSARDRGGHLISPMPAMTPAAPRQQYDADPIGQLKLLTPTFSE